MLSSLVFAASSSQATLKPVNINDDITYQLPNTAYTLVDVTINEQSISIPLIKFESQLAISKGVVVIIADLDAQGNAQSSLYEVAKSLPKWGWNTLYVVPQAHFFVKPLVPNNAAKVKKTGEMEKQDPNKALSEQDEQVLANNKASVDNENDPKVAIKATQQTGLKPFNLQAPNLHYEFSEYHSFSANIWQQITDQALQKTGYKILLAQGKSASAAFSVLSAQASNTDQGKLPFHALIVTNVYWPDPYTNQSIPSLLSKIQLPVLDLVSQSDNQWALITAKQRMLQSKVQLKPLYRQRDIQDIPFTSQQTEYFAKEVIAWTQYLGW